MFGGSTFIQLLNASVYLCVCVYRLSLVRTGANSSAVTAVVQSREGPPLLHPPPQSTLSSQLSRLHTITYSQLQADTLIQAKATAGYYSLPSIAMDFG